MAPHHPHPHPHLLHLLLHLLLLLTQPTHGKLSTADIHNLHRLSHTTQTFHTAHTRLQQLRHAHSSGTLSSVDETTLQLLQAPPLPPPTLHNVTVQLPINHLGPSPAPYTFPNRFFVVDEYYQPGGPVFVFDTGETADAYDYREYLTSELSFFNGYLREFGGLGILWEHRYYGGSLPFRVDLRTGSGEMRWLTTEQALLDFVVFARGFRWRIGGGVRGLGGGGGGFGSWWEVVERVGRAWRRRRGGDADKEKRQTQPMVGTVVDFNPKTTPWVVVGGSYPGMRAAMLREKYPDVVFAAYASSAPIQASTNMTFYWDQVHRGMREYGLANCTTHIHSALSYIDAQLSTSPTSAAAIKEHFLGRNSSHNSHEVFSDVLFYPMYAWQALGASDPVLQEFCRVLERGEDGRDVRESTGRNVADRWAKWSLFAQLVNAYNPAAYCEGFVTNNAKEPRCELDKRYESVLGISWTWQYCSEWGFLQASNVGPQALGSRFNTLAHQQAICYRQFPDGLASGYLPPTPRTEATNRLYGGWEMRPSNTFWTTGEWDPWRTLTPLSSESFALNTPVTGEIPACGVRPRERLFGYTLDNSEHCYDFDPAVNNPRAGVAQRLFAKALKQWLECFGKEPQTA